MVKKLNIFIYFLFNVSILVVGGFYGYNDLQNKKVVGLAGSDVGKSDVAESGAMSKITVKEFDSDVASVLGETLSQGESVQPETTGNPSRDLFADTPEKETDSEENTKNDFSFAVLGDSESYNQKGFKHELISVIENVKTQNPNLVFFVGDVISLSAPTLEENEQRLNNLLSVIGGNFEKYHIAFGNHDIECGLDCVKLWQKLLFKKETNLDEKLILHHSFDYQGTHFAILSSDFPLEKKIDDSQLDWLDHDLAATKKTNKIIFIHVPPVTFFEESVAECHDMSCDSAARVRLTQILAKHKVDLIVSGHENVFDHKIVDGIDYVLAGSIGNKSKYSGTIKGDIYSVFSVKDGEISLKAEKTDGEIAREIKIK